MERRRMVFSGRVQGVGFRATARSIAERHGVTGWVRNDPAGTVTAELQGTAEAIEATIDDLARRMADNIERASASDVEPVEGERGFRVTG